MPHTFEELKSKTIEDLRDIAKGLDNEAVKGFSQMNKAHLLPALCKALGLDTYVHHHVEGIDKSSIKARIKALKKQRDVALEKHDEQLLKTTRRQLHHFNRQIRAHMHSAVRRTIGRADLRLTQRRKRHRVCLQRILCAFALLRRHRRSVQVIGGLSESLPTRLDDGRSTMDDDPTVLSGRQEGIRIRSVSSCR